MKPPEVWTLCMYTSSEDGNTKVKGHPYFLVVIQTGKNPTRVWHVIATFTLVATWKKKEIRMRVVIFSTYQL